MWPKDIRVIKSKDSEEGLMASSKGACECEHGASLKTEKEKRDNHAGGQREKAHAIPSD